MKLQWKSHRDQDGNIDQNVIVCDTHTIVKAMSNLFVCFRKGKPMAKIIGRWSTPALARQCCELDFEGKPYPPDTVETYPADFPTLDSQGKTPENYTSS